MVVFLNCSRDLVSGLRFRFVQCSCLICLFKYLRLSGFQVGTMLAESLKIIDKCYMLQRPGENMCWAPPAFARRMGAGHAT